MTEFGSKSENAEYGGATDSEKQRRGYGHFGFFYWEDFNKI